ncbi:Bacteriophage T7 tail fibre protein [uncultured Caudovirales phage]|uniref:Bacteriophage T7 tail fibre protein n=1 Tax=uncultured Caudovirales phage TaxID=2100421 RepID=A0A6J5L3N8_9CAUD|nr:Bacteriophage T7 tail fibre protein [uncultured Caudovirales phage]
MTISAGSYAPLSYTGDATTTTFTVSWPFFDAADLVVTVAGVTKTLNRDYTVTGGSDAVGTVVFSSAPAAAASVQIARATTVKQQTAYSDYGPFPARSHEQSLDRITMLGQEAVYTTAQTLRAPLTDAALSTLPVAADRANLYLAFDNTGQPIVTAVAPSGTLTASALGTNLVQASTAAAARAVISAAAVSTGLYSAVSTGGTSTAATATVSPTPTAYAAGMLVALKITTTLDENATLNLNSLGAKKAYVQAPSGPVQIGAGDAVASDDALFYYDATLDSAAGGFMLLSAGARGWRTLSVSTPSAAASVSLLLPVGYRRFRLTLRRMQTSAAVALLARFSSNGGSSYLNAASYQTDALLSAGGSATAVSTTLQTSITMSSTLPAAGPNPFEGTWEIDPGNATFGARIRCLGGYGVSSAPAFIAGLWSGQWAGTAATMNAMQILVSSGTLTGIVELEGLR